MITLKLIALILVSLRVLAPTAGWDFKDNAGFYQLDAVVVDLDMHSDTVMVEDQDGNLWEYYSSDVREIGDRVSMIMDGNSTSNIYDDEIVFVN